MRWLLSRLRALYRAVPDAPGLAAIANTRLGTRLRRGARQATLVRESGRYLLASLLEPPGIHRYVLRSTGRPVWLRHPEDSWTFEEVLGAATYALPADVERELGAEPLVVDLGANIGLFGAYILAVAPSATVVGYEPDPGNALLCRKTLGWAIHAGRYRLIEAAAGTASGTASFAAALGARSRLGNGDGDGGPTLTVRVDDALGLLREADLAKIDIEGGEWPLLADARLRGSGPKAIALEYHPWGSPEVDAGQAARRLLQAAGYRIVDPPRAFAQDEFAEGMGMLWAVKGDGARPTNGDRAIDA
jgi:FkbM family methyltransferase